MPDVLKLSLWVGLGAIAVALVCLVAVAWANSGSRNLALVTSTLVAVLLLFATQLLFELRERSVADFFTAEFTIDRKSPQIRQWSYPVSGAKGSGWRIHRELAASAFLAKSDSARFDGDRERLTSDMVLFSLVSYLGVEQSDWQLKRTVFQGPSVGTVISTQPVSRPEECTNLSAERLQELLAAAGNAFAKADIMVMAGRLCLPPRTVLSISQTGLRIATPYCTVSFNLEPSGSVSYWKPGTGGEIPQLDNGESQLETRLTGIRALVEFSWIRAQSRDMQKYEEWSDRVIQGARLWFGQGEI